MSMNSTPTAFGRISAPRLDWLAKTPAETIIEPDLAIVDTHHHLWGDRGSYLIDELLGDASSGHKIEATVFIECRQGYRKDGPIEMRPVGEVEFVARLAAESDARPGNPTRVAAGIVGYADLTLGDRVTPVLEAMATAGQGRFKGVRSNAGFHDDPIIGNNHHGAGPGHYLRSDFQIGVRRLAAMGHSLDTVAFFHQLGDVAALARSCPEASIVMNHCGMPLGYGPFAGQQAEVHAIWLEHLKAVAACPNVTAKLGGMMMRLASFDYGSAPRPLTSVELADHWRPYIEPCIELFGANRCHFESNFPVDKMGIGYAPMWNAFKCIATKASADEKKALFSGTAKRVYRIG